MPDENPGSSSESSNEKPSVSYVDVSPEGNVVNSGEMRLEDPHFSGDLSRAIREGQIIKTLEGDGNTSSGKKGSKVGWSAKYSEGINRIFGKKKGEDNPQDQN